MPTLVNLHWKYFFDYFRPVRGTQNRQSFSELNQVFYETRVADYTDAVSILTVANATVFTLRTTYPGLLTGSGYRHETGDEGELKLGFSFDFTTGLPLLPGSSVKGLLRSVFPVDPKRNQLHDRAIAFVKYLLQKRLNERLTELFPQETILPNPDAIDPIHLEHELFCGQMWNATKKTYADLPLHQHDVFYDALIGFYVPKPKKGKEIMQSLSIQPYKQSVLGNDFITPHRNRNNPRMSPFTNPKPIQFLKVLPSVPVTFQFGLPDRPGQLLTPKQREVLYRIIIEELGVGAKTRVGYGQLV